MQPAHRPEPLELGSLTRSRSASISTTISSEFQFPKMNMTSPPPVTPEPAFIAASAASQIIAAELESNEVRLGGDEGGAAVIGNVVVTPASLSLLNGFLDHLLFNILAAAKSTQLSSIRPAVADVLKPRLAKEVVSAADEELSEYMGGGEDEESELNGDQEPRGEFDLIRSWKLARLRCMVYTRLGDMEEEEEEDYIEREGLGDGQGDPRGVSSHAGSITPAAAIFLTSIIEYIAEQALLIAGETARSRMSAKMSSNCDRQGESGVEQTCQLVVEDIDVEKLAMNSTLGRLWRTWKKRVRGPALSRTVSKESFIRRGYTTSSRKSSIITLDEPLGRDASVQTPVAEDQEQVDPASGANDVNETELPGPAADDAEVETAAMQATVAQKVRPRSLMVVASPTGLPTPTSPNTGSPSTSTAHKVGDSTFGHNRSMSLPTPTYPPHSASSTEDPDNNGGFVTPTEERMQLETMYEHDESAEATIDGAGSSAQHGTTAPERRDSMEPEARGRPESDRDVARQVDASVSVPTAASAQRPQGKSSREVSRKEGGSTYSQEASDSVRQSHMQGTNSLPEPHSASTQSTINHHYVNSFPMPARSSGPNISTATTSKSQTETPGTASCEQGDAPEGTPRRPQATPRHVSRSSESIGAPPPSTSDDSDGSGSRTRSRTNSQKQQSGNQNRHEQVSPVVPQEPERAAVQRVSGRPSMSRDSGGSQSRRSLSISSSREKRPPTAGSTASHVSSKLKGLIGLQQGAGHSRMRSSSEATGKSGEGADDAKSELDKLVDSEETIHYTLTPPRMREMDVPDSSQHGAPRTSTSEQADFLKNTAPPVQEQQRPQSPGRKPLRGVNGLRAHPPDPSDIPDFYKARYTAIPQSSKPKPQARDARPAAESTREIAEFIRSTGPPLSKLPGSLQNDAKQQRGEPGSAAGDVRSGTSTNVSRRSSTKDTSMPKRNGPRLEARPAVTSKSDQTTALIDFIREGPPVPGGHRIPRTVAPFRTTMDSDELQALGPVPDGNDAATRNSVVSAQDGSTTNQSLYSSSNSHTGLLESTNGANDQASQAVQSSAPSASSDVLPGSSAPDDDVRPARKQRRVPDPYAIPDSDDEEDLDELLDAPKRKQEREEESLIDFLRNAPPPPENDRPPQPFSVNSAPPKTSSGLSTASSVKSRFMRSTSLDKIPSPKPSRSSLRARRYTSAINPGSISIPSSPATPGVSDFSSHMDSNNSTGQSNYSSKPISPRKATVTPITQRRTATSDLADFLRNTGPPEPPAPRASSIAEEEKDSSVAGSFSKLFSRRKKVEV